MLLTKFGKHPIKHVEEEAIIVRRKKELDIAAVTDGVSCRLWDLDPWLTPVSLFIPQMWCKCMKYMNLLSNIKEVMHF